MLIEEGHSCVYKILTVTEHKRWDLFTGSLVKR